MVPTAQRGEVGITVIVARLDVVDVGRWFLAALALAVVVGGGALVAVTAEHP